MPNILVLSEQPQFRTLLSESLWFEGYRVESVDGAATLWKQLDKTQPDLVLLDAHLDGFGAMRLHQYIKRQFPDLAVMVYQCRDYSDVNRIRGVVAEALIKHGSRGPTCDQSSYVNLNVPG
jgi:DNA-binding NtrC family response regulator